MLQPAVELFPIREQLGAEALRENPAKNATLSVGSFIRFWPNSVLRAGGGLLPSDCSVIH